MTMTADLGQRNQWKNNAQSFSCWGKVKEARLQQDSVVGPGPKRRKTIFLLWQRFWFVKYSIRILNRIIYIYIFILFIYLFIYIIYIGYAYYMYIYIYVYLYIYIFIYKFEWYIYISYNDKYIDLYYNDTHIYLMRPTLGNYVEVGVGYGIFF